MKKPNLFMAFQWLIFLPIILPICLIFGALQGIASSAEQVVQRIWADVTTVESNNLELEA
jgi:hypothetical protein